MKTTIRLLAVLITVTIITAMAGQVDELSFRDGLSGVVLLSGLSFLIWRASRDSSHHPGW